MCIFGSNIGSSFGKLVKIFLHFLCAIIIYHHIRSMSLVKIIHLVVSKIYFYDKSFKNQLKFILHNIYKEVYSINLNSSNFLSLE